MLKLLRVVLFLLEAAVLLCMQYILVAIGILPKSVCQNSVFNDVNKYISDKKYTIIRTNGKTFKMVTLPYSIWNIGSAFIVDDRIVVGNDVKNGSLDFIIQHELGHRFGKQHKSNDLRTWWNFEEEINTFDQHASMYLKDEIAADNYAIAKGVNKKIAFRVLMKGFFLSPLTTIIRICNLAV